MTSNEKGGDLNVTTALRQARAALVAEFAFKQRLERIAWEEEVLKPELSRLAKATTQGEIPQFTIHED